MVYLIGRGMLIVAAALFAFAFLIGVLPVRERLVVYEPGKSVSCGSVLIPSSYAGDDACEDRLLGRLGWIVLPCLVAVPVGGFGLGITASAFGGVPDAV